MVNLSVIGSSESIKPWRPVESLKDVPMADGNSLFDDDLSIHLLTGIVLPGDWNLTLMASYCVKASVRRHLSCIAKVSNHYVSFSYEVNDFYY